MNHGSLFSGVGGFDLASEWMGWDNVFHCEWNEFGRKVLKYYWTKAISYGDITKTDFTIHRGQIDIITGGFPCQPFSTAGKRKGTEDERHLWPEMLRAIRDIRPTYIVGENVPGILNWSKGLVFEQVCTDLEAEGYSVQPVILPACGVNAPHRRDRVWFVAKRVNTDTNSRRLERPTESGRDSEYVKREGGIGVAPDTEHTGLERGIRTRESIRPEQGGKKVITDWQDFPTQSPVCQRNDGISTRLSGITFPKWRNESIKAMGNAIVPQIALQIFKTIQKLHENENN